MTATPPTMLSRLPAAAALTLGLLVSQPAAGAVISQSESWSAGIGVAPSTIVFDPFDPSLGSLTRVEVVLSGTMIVEAFASQFSVGPGSFAPYSFAILSRLDSISPGGTGFSFGDPARWLSTHTALGTGNNVVATSSFELGFEFGASSDLLGFTLADVVAGFTQPPTTINGQRADFLEDPVNQLLGIQQSFMLGEFPQVIGAPVPVIITGLRFSGVMQLDYIYAPRQEVPEPGSIALLGLTLLLLVARRRALSRR